jgi:hypothetical protein
MKRWVPGLLATRRLLVLAFGGFALMLAIALALQFQLLELPVDALIFLVTPIAFVGTWPAVCVISARVEYEAETA